MNKKNVNSWAID